MVGNWGMRAGKIRENGNDSDSWGEKEEIQLWIEKGFNKPREWQREDGLTACGVSWQLELNLNSLSHCSIVLSIFYFILVMLNNMKASY